MGHRRLTQAGCSQCPVDGHIRPSAARLAGSVALVPCGLLLQLGQHLLTGGLLGGRFHLRIACGFGGEVGRMLGCKPGSLFLTLLAPLCHAYLTGGGDRQTLRLACQHLGIVHGRPGLELGQQGRLGISRNALAFAELVVLENFGNPLSCSGTPDGADPVPSPVSDLTQATSGSGGF